MTDHKGPREQLDTLLAGIEDEVLRLHQTGQRLADEGEATGDVGTMRSNIESLIYARAGDPEQRQASLRGAGVSAKGTRAKVMQAMQQLGHWSGLVQDAGASGAPPRVRMAFSGKPLEGVGKTTQDTVRHRQGKLDDSGDENR